jgi:orotidine-5'-phosphate decarboxylase
MNVMKNQVMLALDVDSIDEALHFANLIGVEVGALKIGPRLVVRYGAELITRLSKIAPVFVDCKYLDIPSTMDAAIRASFEAGASFATIHAWAGPEAMAVMAKTEAELSQKRPFQILVVTILTSFNQKNLPPPLEKYDISGQVSALVDMAAEKGLRGFVCSPHEARTLRKNHGERFLVTPGVRMPGDVVGDQVRVMTASEAIYEGASAIVVGRSLIKDMNPKEKLRTILESISR